MRALVAIVTTLIVVFAVASGGYKMAGGEADVRIFAFLGMSPPVVRLFGLVQLVSGLGVLSRSCGVAAAAVLAACNAVATAGLFSAGEQPFAWISWIFVLMAGVAVTWARARRVAPTQ
jgi:ABC-type glycerol-3-phosphate transport system permease component